MRAASDIAIVVLAAIATSVWLVVLDHDRPAPGDWDWAVPLLTAVIGGLITWVLTRSADHRRSRDAGDKAAKLLSEAHRQIGNAIVRFSGGAMLIDITHAERIGGRSRLPDLNASAREIFERGWNDLKDCASLVGFLTTDRMAFDLPTSDAPLVHRLRTRLVRLIDDQLGVASHIYRTADDSGQKLPSVHRGLENIHALINTHRKLGLALNAAAETESAADFRETLGNLEAVFAAAETARVGVYDADSLLRAHTMLASLRLDDLRAPIEAID
jgi:hypothetical protein